MLKNTQQTGLKKFLLLVKLKIPFHGHVINDLNGEEIIGTFYEEELQKTNQQEFRIEKVINYMSNGKVMIVYIIAGLIKKIWCDSII